MLTSAGAALLTASAIKSGPRNGPALCLVAADFAAAGSACTAEEVSNEDKYPHAPRANEVLSNAATRWLEELEDEHSVAVVKEGGVVLVGAHRVALSTVEDVDAKNRSGVESRLVLRYSNMFVLYERRRMREMEREFICNSGLILLCSRV